MVVCIGTIGTCQCALDKFRRLQSKSYDLVFIYEAGPCGYGFYGYRRNKDQVCWIATLTLISKRLVTE